LRYVLFRAGVVIVVLSPLVLVELLLRAFVPAPAVTLDDPYISFAATTPLFVPDATGEVFETDEQRLTFFRRQSFQAVKGRKTFRVFCLGGSTVQGRPYSVETSFTTWLELNLRATNAEVDWEVVNCGGISYASYRLVPIMREALAYEPDLFIVYTGHNEFIEDRTYGRLKQAPRWLIDVHHRLLWLRSYSLADEYLAGRRNRSVSKTVLPAEVEAKLDYREGLESYHRDELWRQGTIEHFGRNLETMVRMCREAEVPVILVNPVSNLKDSPPFKSEFGADTSAGDQKRIVQLWRQAAEVDWSDAQEKARLLREAAAIDSSHAGLLYLLGDCYERMGRSVEAKQWFLRAKNADICPLRMLEPMHDVIAEVAARNRVPLVDAMAIIEQCTDDGIAGDEWLLDHVHPTIAGHQLIAESLYEKMGEMGLVEKSPEVGKKRDKLWMEHVSSLSEVYYAKGAARLKRLQEWSRGRIPKAPNMDSGASN
jgi:hypothetical protein